MKATEKNGAKWYLNPTIMVRAVTLLLTIGAIVGVGVTGNDPVKMLLDMLLALIVGLLVEAFYSAIKSERMARDLRDVQSATGGINAIREQLEKRDNISPKARSRLEDISASYEECQAKPLSLFATLADAELKATTEKMRSLGAGHHRLDRQNPHVVDSSWEPMVGLAAKGDLIIATSAVTAQWWKDNGGWIESNQHLIERGVGVVRIFFYRSQQDYEDLRPLMCAQAKIGVQVNAVAIDDINRIGRRVRDIMLVKAQVSDLNNPINNGKQVSEASALGEQYLLDNHEDWKSLTMSADRREIAEACEDMTAYLRVSKRLEDDCWAQDFFDSDLHLIMGSRDPDATQEVTSTASILMFGPDKRYIDLGAGYGRIAIPIALEYPVEVLAVEQGQELFDEMQREFERSAYEHSQLGRRAAGKLVLKHGDIRSLLDDPDVEPSSYDGAFSVFDSFGYYQAESENQKLLETVAKVLKPDAPLVLDLINPMQVHRRVGAREWGNGVTSYGYYDVGRKRLLESYMVKNSVYKFKPLVSLRVYPLQEIRDLLEQTGYECSQPNYRRYGNLTKLTSYDDHAPRLVIAARRKK